MFPLRDLVAADVAPDAGRRVRHRVETRTNLHDAAVRLFSERGYEATGVDDIAEAAGVSLRTFFRYFAGKDDVLFAKEMDASRFLDDLAHQSGAPSPVGAIHIAYAEQPPLSTADVRVHVLFHRAVGSSPTLQGRYLAGMRQFREELAGALATRDGRRRVTDTDRLAASVGRTVLDHAYVGWLERGARGDLRRSVDTAFGRLASVAVGPLA
jgi:AcrR family transcriptional regulator